MQFNNIIKKTFKTFQNNNTLFLISIVWIFAILSGWGLRQAFILGEFSNPLLVSDYWVLSNYTSWIPLSNEAAQGNIFPIHFLTNGVEPNINFFPYLSLWISGIFIYIFGVSGAFLIGSLIFSVLSYILMVLIYRRYLPWIWSIFLSSIGILSISSAPFREFLLGLVVSENWKNLGVEHHPDIVNFPFPSISLLFFLFAFFLSTKRVYLSKRRITIISIVWGAQSQIHIINAIIGIPFWLVFVVFTIWRTRKNHWNISHTKFLFLQLLIIAFFFLPILIQLLLQHNNIESFDFMFGGIASNNSLDWLFISMYFILPLVTLGLAYWVFRIDSYELIYKFLPVWIMMFVEFLLILLWDVLGIGIPKELIFSRVGLFFLHLFYFTPSIYCMHRSSVNYYSGTESLSISRRIRQALYWIFNSASRVYIPLFMVLLTLFTILSSNKSLIYFQENAIPFLSEEKKVLQLLSDGVQRNEVLIGPNNLTNITIMAEGVYNSLWTNKFINKINKHEVIEKFALYAKIIGWSEEQFLLFMTPVKPDFVYSSKKINLTSSDVVPGLGYWLTFHNSSINEKQSVLYDQLRSVYKSINIQDKIVAYNVKRILLQKDLKFSKEYPGKIIDNYKIIDFY